MWSAAVIDPALPRRRLAARASSVLSHHADRVVAEGAHIRRRGVLFFAVGDHDGDVHIKHDRGPRVAPGTVGCGHPACRWDPT